MSRCTRVSLLDGCEPPVTGRQSSREGTYFTDGRVWLEETGDMPGVMLTAQQHARWVALGCPDDASGV